MGRTETVTLTLTPELAAELREAAAAGGLATIGDVVRLAVDEWRATRAIESWDKDELRRLIQEGADSGPGIPAGEAFAELLAKYEAAAAKGG